MDVVITKFDTSSLFFNKLSEHTMCNIMMVIRSILLVFFFFISQKFTILSTHATHERMAKRIPFIKNFPRYFLSIHTHYFFFISLIGRIRQNRFLRVYPVREKTTSGANNIIKATRILEDVRTPRKIYRIFCRTNIKRMF